jgi:hypothetical protein
MLVFDNEGEYTPENMERLLGAFGFGGKRDRPYNGQPWTANGARGQTIVTGLTMRDIADCFARGAVLAGLGDDTPNIDRDAVLQAGLCEIEKMMGIFPNVPDGPMRIPTLMIGDAPPAPPEAS